MKIYTRTGDAGETSLFGGERVRKDSVRIEAYGTVDELNAQVGVARAAWPGSPIDSVLEDVQSDLFDIGAQLASPGGEGATSKFAGVPGQRAEALEAAIDAMDAELPPLKTFVLPGGSLASAQLHVARTVCRRAERLVVALDETGNLSGAIVYLNRLSDYLFVAARFANARAGVPDVPWKKR